MRLNFKYWFSYGIILFSCILVFIEATDFATTSWPGNRAAGDHTHYFAMSEHTFSAVSNPFAFRVLSPFIVHEMNNIFHIGLDFGWMLLTFISIFLSLVIFLHLLHKHFKIDLFISLMITLALVFTYNFSYFNFRDFWLVDPLNNLFFILGIYFILKEKLLAFIVVMIIGFLNKEVVLLLLPLYPLSVLAKRQNKNKLLFSLVAISIVAALYLFFREIIKNKIGSGATYGFGGFENKNMIDNIKYSLNANKPIASIFQVFNFFWIIAGIFVYRIYQKFGFLHKLVIMPLILFPLLVLSKVFAGDTQRVFILMAPVIFIISAFAFQGYKEQVNKIWLIPILLVYIAMNFSWVDQNVSFALGLAIIIAFITIVSVKKPLLPGDI